MIKNFITWLLNLFAAKPELAAPLAPDTENIPPHESSEPIPWFKALESQLGMKETLPDGSVNPMVTTMFTYTSYKTKENKPWCAAAQNWALATTGYKRTNSAAALSFATYGTPCEFKKGAIVVIQHPAGNHHVTQFSHWVDKDKQIASCLGGNQGNKMKYSDYDFKKEKVIGCRWPIKL